MFKVSICFHSSQVSSKANYDYKHQCIDRGLQLSQCRCDVSYSLTQVTDRSLLVHTLKIKIIYSFPWWNHYITGGFWMFLINLKVKTDMIQNGWIKAGFIDVTDNTWHHFSEEDQTMIKDKYFWLKPYILITTWFNWHKYCTKFKIFASFVLNWYHLF